MHFFMTAEAKRHYYTQEPPAPIGNGPTLFNNVHHVILESKETFCKKNTNLCHLVSVNGGSRGGSGGSVEPRF